MTAKSLVLPGEDPALLAARSEAWKADLKPQSDLEEYLVNRAVQTAWELDRIDRAIAAKLSELVGFGPFDRDEDEADVVQDCARQLFWDPRGPIALYPHWRGFRVTPRVSGPNSLDDPIDPGRVVNRLEGMAAGCRWLLDRWADLRGVLDQGLKWQAPDRLRAIRLLGRQPMDVLSDERVLSIYLACDAMDPTAPTSLDDMMTETEDDELERIKERVQGRGADWKKPASPEAGKAALLALIEHVTTRLEVKLSLHREHQKFEKSVRSDLLAFDDTPEGELARRYQLAKDRELHRTIASYYKVRKEALAFATCDLPDAACLDRDAKVPAAAVELSNDAGDETNPLPPVTVPESRLQAAEPAAIPAEAGTPAVASLEPRLPAELVMEEADETNPTPPERSGDETNPTPAELTLAADQPSATMPAGGPIETDHQAHIRRHRPTTLPPIFVETLRHAARLSMSAP